MKFNWLRFWKSLFRIITASAIIFIMLKIEIAEWFVIAFMLVITFVINAIISQED